MATGLLSQQGRRLVFEHRGIHRAAEAIAWARPDAPDLQRRLADAWEELGRHTGADVNFNHGAHRLHAGEADRALVPLLRATRTALRGGLPHLALRAAELAVRAADATGILMAQVEARQRQAEALLELDDPRKARERIREAQSLGKVDRLSVAHLKEIEARSEAALGDPENARRLLAQAHATFEATRDWAGMVSVALHTGALLRNEGLHDQAADRYAEALRLDRGGDPTSEVQALRGLVECRLQAGQLDPVEQDLARLRKVARESGDTRNIAQSTYVAGLVHLQRRRLDLADRHFQTARALAATLGDDPLWLSCENNLGEVFRYRGDLKAAWQAYDRAAYLAEGRGWGTIAAIARLNLALVELRDHRPDGARKQVDLVDQLLQEHPRHWGWVVVGLIRALLAAEGGDESRCRAWWSVARERGIARLQNPDLWLPLERLANAAAARGWKDISRQAAILGETETQKDPESAVHVVIED